MRQMNELADLGILLDLFQLQINLNAFKISDVIGVDPALVPDREMADFALPVDLVQSHQIGVGILCFHGLDTSFSSGLDIVSKKVLDGHRLRLGYQLS